MSCNLGKAKPFPHLQMAIPTITLRRSSYLNRHQLDMLPYSSFIAALFACILFSSNALMAQPSGGPYGPVQKTYELPNVSGTIYYVAPDGSAAARGTSIDSPTTIETAIRKVATGDAIILRGGTYRTGNLELNQSIVMQPYKDEIPLIKGTYEATDWENVLSPDEYEKGLWRTAWTDFFPSEPANWWRTQRQGMHTPLHKFNNDMVFTDGRFLQSAGWYNELNDDNYYIDYEEGYVYLTSDPSNKTVEITAFNQGLVITPREVNGKKADGKGPTIRGITFTQYAYHVIDVEGYFPEGVSDESEHGKDVVGTTFEHCTVSFGGRVGVYALGDELSMRHCKISDTSTEGVYILASNDVLLEKNVFTRNNIENITGYYPSAVKIFNQSHRVTVNDNLVTEQPDSNGIWYDVGNVDGVFTNNWLENVGSYHRELRRDRVYPSRNAFFFEISEGVKVIGNVLVNNDHGMLILNSSGAKIYNNTLINSMVTFARTRRGEDTDHFGWHINTGPGLKERIHHEFGNNLMVSKGDYDRPLMYIWQLEDMCNAFTEPQLTSLDHNAYVRLNDPKAPLIWMAHKLDGECESTFDSSASLHQAMAEYATNSITLNNYLGPLFKSATLKNLEIAEGFKGASAAGDIPHYVEEILEEKSSGSYIGAYPSK